MDSLFILLSWCDYYLKVIFHVCSLICNTLFCAKKKIFLKLFRNSANSIFLLINDCLKTTKKFPLSGMVTADKITILSKRESDLLYLTILDYS